MAGDNVRTPRSKAFQGGVGPLVDALKPFVTSVRWLDYPEDCKKVNPAKLVACKEWLNKLLLVYKPLSFKMSDVEEVLGVIVKDTSTWPKPLKEQHQAQWIKVHAKRVMLATQHYGKVLRRGKEPKWLHKMKGEGEDKGIVGDKDSDHSDEGGESEPEGSESNLDVDSGANVTVAKATRPEVGYHFGFCEEKRAPWRVRAGTLNKDYTFDVYFEPEAKDSDFVKARWEANITGDMMDREVKEVTVQEWVEMKKVEWETTRGAFKVFKFEDGTHRAVEIQKKKQGERQEELLILVYVENTNEALKKKQGRKQITQVVMRRLLGEDLRDADDDEDSNLAHTRAWGVARNKAMEVLSVVAEKLCRGKIAVEDVSAVKDEEMAKRGNEAKRNRPSEKAVAHKKSKSQCQRSAGARSKRSAGAQGRKDVREDDIFLAI